MNYIFKIIVSSIAVLITSYILKKGIIMPDIITAIVVAFVISILNIFLRPLLIILTIPATIFSFGLFLIILNAIIIELAAYIVPNFEIKSFGWAIGFSLIMSIVTFLLQLPDKLKSGRIIIKKFKKDE
jgi:putative membrane protein